MTQVRTAGLGVAQEPAQCPLSPALGVWWPGLGYRKAVQVEAAVLAAYLQGIGDTAATANSLQPRS